MTAKKNGRKSDANKKKLNIILSPMWFKILDSGSKESNIPLVDNEFESVKILGVLVFT